jgi:hypothetical protein
MIAAGFVPEAGKFPLIQHGIYSLIFWGDPGQLEERSKKPETAIGMHQTMELLILVD